LDKLSVAFGKKRTALEIAVTASAPAGPIASAVVCYVVACSIVVSGVSKNELIASASARLHDKDDILTLLSLTVGAREEFPSSRPMP
jgi:hypothetical protein